MECSAWQQTGRQTRRRCAKKGRLSLTDVLQEAPRVLQLVSPSGKKALLAVCKSLRQLVHAFASRVTLQKDDSMQHLLGTAVGPHLLQLRLHGIKLTGTVVVEMYSAPWSALTSLTLCSCGLNGPIISKLAAGHWPALQHLSLSNNKLSTAAVKAMAGSNWPQLRHLDLSSNKLNASAISQLTQLRWTQLQSLDLDDNSDLDSCAIRKLSCGSWPLLRSLSVSGGFGLGLLVPLAASSWPLLETVQIDCHYCAPQDISFAGCWQNLKNLRITTCLPSPATRASFSYPAVSRLTEEQWTNLETLDLSYSDLGQNGLMQLAQGKWPVLSKLNLTKSQQLHDVTPFGYANFAMGRWPKLTYLSLAENGMSDECAVRLINGDWPLLATLDLSYNDIGAVGSAQPAVADWPHLEHLCLRSNKPDCCECILGRHVHVATCVLPIFTIC